MIFEVFKYVFGLIGLLLIGATVWLYQDNSGFIDEAITADGKVVRLESHSSDDGTTYAPVVVFTARDNQEYQFVSSGSSNPPAYTLGEDVEVLYLENNPFKARINSFMNLWFGVSVVGFLGLAFSAVGVGTIMYPWLQKN